MRQSQNLPFKPGHIVAHSKICGFKVALPASDYPVDSPEIRKFPKAFLTCVITQAQAKKVVEPEGKVNHLLSDLSDPLLNESDVQSVDRSKTCEDVGEEQADPEVVTVHGSQESGTNMEKAKRVSLEKYESLV